MTELALREKLVRDSSWKFEPIFLDIFKDVFFKHKDVLGALH